MSDFIDFVSGLDWPALASLLTSVLSALLSVVFGFIALVNAIKTRSLSAMIDQAKKRGTYIICPRCKKEVYLSEIDFRIPGGSIDQNLNGIADENE